MKQTSSLLTHLAVAIIITGIILLVYAAMQRTYRSTANDPQLQIARDLCASISLEKSINKQLANETIDLLQSLALFKSA